jgi:hypothetical protein
MAHPVLIDPVRLNCRDAGFGQVSIIPGEAETGREAPLFPLRLQHYRAMQARESRRSTGKF